MSRGTQFCFTLNNHNAQQIQVLKDLFEDNRDIHYAVFGLEVAPTTGTEHLQGYVCFTTRKRIGAVRSLLPRCHIEVTRGTPQQAADYCKKDGSFFEFGAFEQIPFQGKRSEFDDFKEWVLGQATYPSDALIAQNWTTLYVRYGRAILNLRDVLYPKPKLETGRLNPGWQCNLWEELKHEPADDRAITFYVDPDGGAGKSWFIRKYLTENVDGQFFSLAKRDDIAHALDVTKRVFFFNIPRDGMQYLQYGILESIKDRLVFSPKYNSGVKMLLYKPHVIVFCNEFPDEGKLSQDRFDIREVTL